MVYCYIILYYIILHDRESVSPLLMRGPFCICNRGGGACAGSSRDSCRPAKGRTTSALIRPLSTRPSSPISGRSTSVPHLGALSLSTSSLTHTIISVLLSFCLTPPCFAWPFTCLLLLFSLSRSLACYLLYNIIVYSILYYTILYYTILYYTILYYTILYHTMWLYLMHAM